MAEIFFTVSDETAAQIEHIVQHYNLDLGDIVSFWAAKDYNRIRRHEDAIVGNCVANQAMEGQICTEEDVAAMRRIITGETTVEDEITVVVSQCRES